jgi:CRP-like cAMP-binding protein
MELLSGGDVTRPWIQLEEETSVATEETATALALTRVAVLDRAWALRMARWPEVPSALMNRLVLRARRLGLQHAISSLPRIEDRLLVILWHFADRWGRVTREGVRMRLPLRHEDLAMIVGAQRPSVSTALGRLEADARIGRCPDRVWLLRGSPPTVLRELERGTALASTSPG